MTRPSIAIALGGGGARGFAHLGVLQVLTREGIPIDAITGTSMGALMGVAFGAGVDLHYLEGLIQHLPWQDFIDIGFHRMGLVNGERVMALIRLLIKGKELEELEPPVWVVATDLQNGDEVVFNQGAADLAVRSSISIPGLFTPVNCENATLVDGGVVAGVPVNVAKRMGKDLVIAVNVAHDFKRATPRNMVDVLMQTIDIMSYHMDKHQIAQADLVISPDVGEVGMLDFQRGMECIQRGREAAERMIPSIRRLLDEKSKASAG